MNLKREFNRIEHLLNDGIEKTRKEAGHWVDEGTKRAHDATRKARSQVDAGVQTATDYEQAVVRQMRTNSTLYLVGSVLIIGLLVAKIVREIRQSRELEEIPLL
jgi:hypothetical protein